MYSSSDEERIVKEIIQGDSSVECFRTPFRKDYDRLIHSPSFRRLGGKTQLFPGKESDFFRNRLTHSLEVAQIAKSIAIRINNLFLNPDDSPIDLDIVEFAGLAHDIGHPPFGHQGEAALDECMINYGGFEGNAQSLRILTKLEKKIYNSNSPIGFSSGNDVRCGLNLTFRTIASVIKYDEKIPYSDAERTEYANNNTSGKIQPIKGYYQSEKDLISTIKKELLTDPQSKLKTVECQIMDIADDIAYSTYDLEDGLKAGFYNILDILFADNIVKKNIAVKVSQSFGVVITENQINDVLYDIFGSFLQTPNLSDIDVNNRNFSHYAYLHTAASYTACKELSKNGYLRTALTSSLVRQFIGGVKFDRNSEDLKLSKVYFDFETKLKVEVLKRFNYESQILSPRLKIVEFRGKEIVRYIFKKLNEENGFELLPFDCRNIYNVTNVGERARLICDFVSSMTDNYCIEFYGRLMSEEPETIFKPFF